MTKQNTKIKVQKSTKNVFNPKILSNKQKSQNKLIKIVILKCVVMNRIHILHCFVNQLEKYAIATSSNAH